MPDRPFPATRPLALVGLMGSGKSTVGRLLASRFDVPLVDSDLEIERSTGTSIASLFETKGEAGFRRVEREWLETLDLARPSVIATGGGLFVDAGSRARLLDHCITIWLDAPTDRIASRLSGSIDRPMLRTGDPVQVLDRLARLRREYYQSAHLRVDCGDQGPETIADRVEAQIRRGSDRLL